MSYSVVWLRSTFGVGGGGKLGLGGNARIMVRPFMDCPPGQIVPLHPSQTIAKIPIPNTGGMGEEYSVVRAPYLFCKKIVEL